MESKVSDNNNYGHPRALEFCGTPQQTSVGTLYVVQYINFGYEFIFEHVSADFCPGRSWHAIGKRSKYFTTYRNTFIGRQGNHTPLSGLSICGGFHSFPIFGPDVVLTEYGLTTIRTYCGVSSGGH